jgi:hypothetical protein
VKDSNTEKYGISRVSVGGGACFAKGAENTHKETLIASSM